MNARLRVDGPKRARMMASASWHGPVMASLGVMFFLRVIGQLLVRYAGVTWLPAEEHWQSGLLPYPALLLSQVLVLIVMTLVTRDTWRGDGPLVARGPRVARFVRAFGVVYAASMVIRYIVTMALVPEWRWLGHSIPTAFHLVLATFILVYSGAALSGSDATAHGADVMREGTRYPERPPTGRH